MASSARVNEKGVFVILILADSRVPDKWHGT